MTVREGNAVPASRPVPTRVAIRLFGVWWAVVVCAAVAGGVLALIGYPGGLHAWGKAGLLLALAFGFDEASRRAARLRIRLSGALHTDMTSVWAVAASASLPRGTAVAVMLAVLTYAWFRHQRPAGELLHRKVFGTATIVLGSLAASTGTHAVLSELFGSVHLSAPTALSVLSVLVVYTVVQRALVVAGVVALGARGRALVGSRDDNLIELATLCLGGLVGLALHFEPLLAILALAPMITLQRGALIRELETAASTDAKTGLLNAVAWEQVAQREVARSTRDGMPLAVLIIDIDHFKLVNDQYGHLVGDMVLRGLGRELVSMVREYDSTGRFGGEEFVVVLPSASLPVAAAIAERIRARVNTLTVADLADHEVEVTAESATLGVCIGVSMMGEHGHELPELLQAADVALYRAKAAGRNRVVLAERGAGGTDREAVGS